MTKIISTRHTPFLATPLAAFFLLTACATTTPVELKNARTAYSRASTGPAAQRTPADLHIAKTALDKAEATFAEEENSQKTIDLAYIAERKAQLAEARAQAAIAQEQNEKATQELADTKDSIAKQTQGDLIKAKEQLGQAQQGQAQQAQQTAAERQARQQAELATAEAQKKTAAAELAAKEANDALAKLAAKEEERGMVITLSGSVLFRSNKSELMPSAQQRLDQVAEALASKGRDVLVEGHTDSQGSQATNVNLSQRRAESVRTYLISRGLPSAQVQARGMGSERPIAENNNAEGRANNRRVEIVIAKAPSKAN